MKLVETISTPLIVYQQRFPQGRLAVVKLSVKYTDGTSDSIHKIITSDGQRPLPVPLNTAQLPRVDFFV